AAALEAQRRAAEAAALEELRRAMESAALEEQRRAAEVAALEELRRAAEAAALEAQRRAAEAAALEEQRREEQRRAAEAAALEEQRRAAEAAAAEREAQRVAAEDAARVLAEFVAEPRMNPEPVAEPITIPNTLVAAGIEIVSDAPEREVQHTIAAQIPEPIAPQIVEPAAVAPPPAAQVQSLPPLETFQRLADPSVVPLTRTVRIEVPPRVPPSRSTDIERLLRIAAARGASALYVTSESRPYIRVEGDIRQLEGEPVLSRSDVETAIVEIAPESGREPIGKGEVAEWLREYPELGRIRCTTFNDHRGPGVILRMIATRAATAESLGLPPEVQALATESQGLVLVAGPRASGKSTLLSALVDLINRQRAEFVITLERQIRLVHDNRSALVSQREIRGGADEALAAARSALREGPDVLVIDDLISPQMVPLILTAASEGLLVFVSIAAPSTSDAVQRFIELAAPEMRGAVLTAMAESFRGAVAQTLLKKTGGGLIAAREVLLATAPVTRVIGEGQLEQLPHALEGGRKHGMQSFAETLVDYVRGGSVDVREAFRKAPDRDRLLAGLKRDKIDTSLVERLA
ncbi:MAG TPA: ATPase, T2SS/T4P/T4SS family, partial [Vicinamibacterales bacterium]|nr:ATPase, T2SS/T4P/T4SS family [Vicinamibacterales bacterium]